MTERSTTAALLVSRVLLLVAVLTGLGAMHVLDSPGAMHGAMPMAGASGTPVSSTPVSSTPVSSAVATASARPGGSGADDRASTADCILFAATGVALLGALLAAAARRHLALLGAPRARDPLMREVPARRGPPRAARPRTALCVLRT